MYPRHVLFPALHATMREGIPMIFALLLPVAQSSAIIRSASGAARKDAPERANAERRAERSDDDDSTGHQQERNAAQ